MAEERPIPLSSPGIAKKAFRMDYKKLNIWLGWVVFLVASATYLTTMEPTASFWDCGEFIATAYKLEVGHPPGAPFFMILARVFSAFVSPEHVPLMVNIISALASAFTILFLFWSITYLAMKMAGAKDSSDVEFTDSKKIAVLGSGLVGALAYAWSDSFWFSAVEGEVYALSSLFTAVVFWAILRWDANAHRSGNLRWIILIAYLMGLSIGVHLLNLLCIPAIAFVYYFRKYEPTRKGVLITGATSVAILGVIQVIIIGGTVKFAGTFERVFVNGFGMPFNSGNLFYILLIFGGLGYGIHWSQQRGKALLNTALLSILVILLGYSTFAMITIRSYANPPIDENNPENVFSLLSYLNREQYGDRPLLSGQFWDSPQSAERKDGNPVYSPVWIATKNGREVKTFFDGWQAELYAEENPDVELEGEYRITDDRKGTIPVYPSEFTMIFPRMYSNQAHHIPEYKRWSNFKGKPVSYRDGQGSRRIMRPTFGENLTFFFNYQVGWMYGRYFMWNFAGRQNDIQGHGNVMDGNWLSGLDFIDEERLGSQEFLPSTMLNNKGYNKLFLLPLILGLIGLVYQLMRDIKNWSVVALLFFFTGLAIVIYLNQYPIQPRERDYAYVGSFYAFAMWMGLGVYSLFDAGRTMNTGDLMKVGGISIGLGVLKYLQESLVGADHSTSFMILYMAIVAILLLGLFVLVLGGEGKDRVRAMLATVLCLAVPVLMVAEEWDDHNRAKRETARDMAADYLESCAPNAILFTNGDNDTFPLWYVQEVEGIRTDVRVVNLSLLNTDWYADQMRRKAYDSDPIPWTTPAEKFRQGTRDYILLDPANENKSNQYLDVRRSIDFIANDEKQRRLGQGSLNAGYVPTKHFRLPVDKDKVIANGTVSEADSNKIVPAIDWTINKRLIMKNHYMVLDMLASFDWDRPIYFAVTTGPESYIGLQEHFQLEGLTYRLIPVKTPKDRMNPNLQGRVAGDIMYDNVMNKFRWGNMDSEEAIYFDENVLRMATNIRLQLSNLADQLIKDGKNDKAEEVLDLSLQVMPNHNVPFDRILLPTVMGYYELGENEKANQLSEHLFDLHEEKHRYFMSLDDEFMLDRDMQQELQAASSVISQLLREAQNAGQQDLVDKYESRTTRIITESTQRLQQLQTGRKTIRGTF